MLLHHSLAKQLAPITAAFGTQDLIVFTQLHFVVVYSFAKVVTNRISVLYVVQLLKTVDCNTEDLASTLQN